MCVNPQPLRKRHKNTVRSLPPMITLALLAMAPATTNKNSSDYFPTLCRAITSETWDQTGNLLLLYTVSPVLTILYHKLRICQYPFACNFKAEGVLQMKDPQSSKKSRENLLHLTGIASWLKSPYSDN